MFRSDTQDRDQSDTDLKFIEHRKNSYNTSDPIPKSKWSTYCNFAGRAVNRDSVAIATEAAGVEKKVSDWYR